METCCINQWVLLIDYDCCLWLYCITLLWIQNGSVFSSFVDLYSKFGSDSIQLKLWEKCWTRTDIRTFSVCHYFYLFIHVLDVFQRKKSRKNIVTYRYIKKFVCENVPIRIQCIWIHNTAVKRFV